MQATIENTPSMIRRACIRAAASAIYYSGALNLIRPLLYRRPRGGTWQNIDERVNPFAVLLYHRVNADEDPFFPALSTEAFDAQMKYLAAHYHVLSLGEIVQRLRSGTGIPQQTIAVTFDDGYRDNYLYAHPILKKYKLPATLFAATGYIGTAKLMWNDRIALAVKLTKEESFTFPGSNQPMSLGSQADRLRAFQEIIGVLKTLPDQNKEALVEKVVSRLCSKEPEIEPVMLTWAELRKLAQEGWEVGSHTVNHVILSRVSLSQAKDEISASSSILQKELDQPIRLFAYPNGKSADFSPAVKDVLRDAGLIAAVTTVDRLNNEGTDLFEIGRNSPWDEPLPAFALRLNWRYWRHTQNPVSLPEQRELIN